jgi:MFS family permease
MNQIRKNLFFGVLHEAVWGASWALLNPLTFLEMALKDLGGTAKSAGLLSGLLFAALNFIQIFSAFWLSPRWTHPKKCAPMHLPAISCVAGMAALFYFFPDMNPSVKIAIFLALGLGFFAGVGVVMPHWVGMIGRSIPRDFRGRYFAWCFALSNLAGVGTGILGAHWAAAGGLKWGFALCFAVAVPIQLLCITLLSRMEPLEAEPEKPGPMLPYLKSRWNTVHAASSFGIFVGLNLLLQLATASGVLFTPYLKDSHFGNAAFDFFSSAGQIGGMAGAFLMGYMADHFGTRWGFGLAFLSLLPCLLYIALGPSLASGTGAFLGNGIANAAYPVVTLYMVMHFAGPKETTSLTGAFNSVMAPSIFLLPLGLGWLADLSGYHVAFSLSMIACVFGVLLLLLRPSFGRREALA